MFFLPMLVRLSPLHERLCETCAGPQLPAALTLLGGIHGALKMLGVPRPHAAGIGIADFFKCLRVWILSC